jgi:hypothetical protein
MPHLVNQGGCSKCRAAGRQYGQDGFQLCLHHEVVSPEPKRDCIPLASLPGRLDPHLSGAMLPLEHVVVGDMSALHKYVHEGEPRGCRQCDVDGSQYAKKVCLRQVPKTQRTPTSDDPYRYVDTLPIQPCDYGNLNSHMQIFLGRDVDSDDMQPGDPYYEVYIRIINFIIYDNNLKDYNDLMDIVYQGARKPENPNPKPYPPYPTPFPIPFTYIYEC